MKKRKVFAILLSTIPFIGICVGATYALFTSNASTSILVTAGKVNVSASIGDLNLYSPTSIDMDTGAIIDDTNAASGGYFANLGTASIDASGKLSLINITPGDKVSFNIDLTNNSNVKIKYRVLFNDCTVYPTPKPSPVLFDELVVKAGGNKVSSTVVPWTLVEPGASVNDLNISVELPTTAPSEVIGQSSELKFSVEAVQGNAYTSNPQSLSYNVSGASLGKIKINDGEFINITEYFNDPVEVNTGDVVYIDPVNLRFIEIKTYTTDPSASTVIFYENIDSIMNFTVESGLNYIVTYFPYAS